MLVLNSSWKLDHVRHAAKQVDADVVWGERFEEEAIAFDTSGRLRYGGKLFRRAVAKIALNVLAWRHPALARDAALGPLKKWILSGLGDYEGVWHDLHPDEAGLPAPSRPFVHRVLISVDAASGDVGARVAFFGQLSVAVHLGTVRTQGTFTRIFDFDPLSPPPEDLRETTLEGTSRSVRPTEDTYVHELHAGIDRILQMAANRAWLETTRDLTHDLNGLRRSLSEQERAAAIKQRLSREQGRVLGLMAGVARWLHVWYPAKEDKATIQKIRRLVSQSRTGPKMVAPRTWRVAAMITSALAELLSHRLIYRPIHPLELRAYFQGLPGHATAIRVMAAAARVPAPSVTEAEIARWLGSRGAMSVAEAIRG